MARRCPDACLAGPLRLRPLRDAFTGGERLRFAAEATRRRRDRLLLFRSDYEQPFGTFAGSLPGGIELVEGFGVTERHEVVW